MMRFKVITEGQNRLNIAGLVEQYANSLWMPDHLTPDQRTEFVLDQFRRMVASELEMVEVEVEDGADFA